jgi:hypothetical protein
MNYLKAGGSQELRPRPCLERPVGLSRKCVEAALKARRTSLGPKVLENPLLGYERVQGALKGPGW